MKNKLISIKRIIESEVGERIDTKNRRRDLTYARSVYCKVGRDMGYSLSAIGNVINRDHATVLHNLRVVFPFGQNENAYKKLYKTMTAVANKMAEEEELDAEREFNIVKELSKKLEKLHKENASLCHKLQLVENENSIFLKMIEGLNEEELKEIYDKLEIMVKAIKSRVYI